MFSCPTCRVGLTQSRDFVGVVWTCARCVGRAVSPAALNDMVWPDLLSKLWARVDERASWDALSCPSCIHAMVHLAVYPERSALFVYLCPACRYAWIGAEEFKLISGMKPPDDAAGRGRYDPSSSSSGPAVSSEKPRVFSAGVSPAREAMARLQIQRDKELWEGEFGAAPPREPYKKLLGFFGFPIDNENKVYDDAWFTWPLVLCVGFFSLLLLPRIQEASEDFGFIPARFYRYGGLTLFTPFFLHAGLSHLFGNLYFLILFGKRVEDYIGRWRNLLLLFSATAVGNLAHMFLDARPEIPCIGASGGISGVIAFYALQFPGARLWFFWWFRWIRVPALLFVGFWVIKQFFIADLQTRGLSDVSALAHLGGAFTGFVFWFFWRKRNGAESVD